MLCACETVCACQRTRALQGDGKRGRRAGKEQRSATPRSLTGWVGGDNQTERAATKPDFDSRVVCGNEKAGAGGFVRHGFFVDAHDPHTAAVA